MAPHSLARLLGASCRVHDVRVGEVVAVLLDADGTRAIGLGIESPGGVRRFLPWVAVEYGEDGVRTRSAFLLVDDGGSYVRHGARAVDDAAELAELYAGSDGTLVRLGKKVSIEQATGTHIR